MNVADTLRRASRGSWQRVRSAAARVRHRLSRAISADVVDVTITSAPDPRIVFPKADDPDVSVVIVSFGHREILADALAKLAAAAAASPLAIEVIVVDQFHPERGHDSADLLDTVTAGIRVYRSPGNLGFSGGNHRGVDLSRASVLCLCNPDILIEECQLDELVAVQRRHPECIVVPRLVNLDGSTQERGWRVIHEGHTRPVLDGDAVCPDYGSAAFWVMARSLFDTVGGFDEGYYPAYYEDVDFALRAAELGHPTLIVDEVPVVHQWSVVLRGGPPDVSVQRARFVERWAELIAERADE